MGRFWGWQSAPHFFVMRVIDVKQRRTERFSVRVEREGSGHAAAESIVENKVQGAEIGQVIANDLSQNHIAEMLPHPLGGEI